MPAYKDEKTKLWYCSFYYTDFQGNKKRKLKRGFAKREDAKQWERKFLETYTQSADITFETLCFHYMEDRKVNLKPTSYNNKTNIVNNHYLPYFKDMRLNEITPLAIRKWQNNLISAGYKPTYLRGLHQQLSAIFNYAIKYFGLKDNPCKVTGSIGSTKAGEMQFWTLDQYNQFMACLSGKRYAMHRVMIPTLFWTGMRIGEMLALTIDDIDKENLTISINKTYKQLNGKDIIQSPKTEKSNRTIDIPQQLADLLIEYATAVQAKSGQRLFEYGGTGLGQVIHTVCKKNNLQSIRVHDLRPSHASYLINKGFSPIVIKERLGHDNIETTLQTYSHLYPSTKENVISTMEKDFK